MCPKIIFRSAGTDSPFLTVSASSSVLFGAETFTAISGGDGEGECSIFRRFLGDSCEEESRLRAFGRVYAGE